MRHQAIAFALISAAMLLSCTEASERDSRITPVDFSKVVVSDNFWQPKIAGHAEVTAPFCIDQCLYSGRVNNFAVAAGIKEGSFVGLLYDDSDLYKSIEGVAYSLQNVPNPELEAKVDSIISLIAAAQWEDGYLNTYYTLAEPGKRWTVMDHHETYCCGHLIEGAIAYYHATGKRQLLDVAIKFADCLCDTFGPEKRDWVPGHEEIELALVKLYRETGEKKYLDLSHFFMEERGRMKADWVDRENQQIHLEYHQDVVPVAELRKITGHAVRSMYLLSGMADYTAQSGDTSYIPALTRVWDDLIESKMYVTGGIGSSTHNEGFSDDFFLPNKDAYCETCASVGMAFWNQRMHSLTGEGKYQDIVEKELYNAALDGISLSCDRFFYVNPLASDGDHHRQPWYQTACCPSQISRFLPSVGGYEFSTSAGTLWVNQYVQSTAKVDIDGSEVGVKVETFYPWDGKVEISFEQDKKKYFDVKLRIPSWCGKWSLCVNGSPKSVEPEDGYVTISGKWSGKDVITLNMEMPVELVAADPRVLEDVGRRAVQRGPVVYCIEAVDNTDMDSAMLSAETTFETRYEEDLLGGVTTILATTGDKTLKFVPYFTWDNREPGKMEVWIPFI